MIFAFISLPFLHLIFNVLDSSIDAPQIEKDAGPNQQDDRQDNIQLILLKEI
jgi:hypothetical protein